MKIRVLYYSNKGKMETFAFGLAEALKRDSEGNTNDVRADVIPPAYACDKERIVFLGISVGKEPDDVLRRFCGELTKQRTQYVALFVDNKNKEETPGLITIKNAIREAGAQIIGDIHFVDGGAPFKFMKKISMDERIAIAKWAENVIKQCN
jgi:hypothetical protein